MTPTWAPEPPEPRDPARIDRMLELLRVAWHAAPDLRLGQLVDAILCRSVRDLRDVWEQEDDVNEALLVEWNKERA